MQIIGRAVEMRVGERFALPISVLAMMPALAAVIVIREKTKQPEQKSSSCFMSLVKQKLLHLASAICGMIIQIPARMYVN